MSWYGSHAFLNEYITQHKCKRIMEIGVYNAENAVSMIKAAIKNHPQEEVEYYGFDFFHSYSKERIAEKLDKLGCKYTLYQGDTMDTVPEAAKTLQDMDIIFIDGGKSYREAWSDWESSSKLMHQCTTIFVHNVGFSGVSRMVENIPRDTYIVDVFYAPSEGRVAQIKMK
jgi:predicted O-methyltransferase YrrM